jgi:peroxiredoxin
MRCRTLVISALMALAATGAHAVERAGPSSTEHPPDRPGARSPIASTTARPYFDVGDRAPEFSFLGTDGRWHALHELLLQGDVMLVFGAREEALREIESMRSIFTDLGVQPVAVLDMSAGSASRYSKRLEIGIPIVSDSQCAIGDLFGSLDPSTRRHAPGYFVVDGKGLIRAYKRGPLPPARRLLAAAARGLSRPLPESAWLLSRAY